MILIFWSLLLLIISKIKCSAEVWAAATVSEIHYPTLCQCKKIQKWVTSFTTPIAYVENDLLKMFGSPSHKVDFNRCFQLTGFHPLFLKEPEKYIEELELLLKHATVESCAKAPFNSRNIINDLASVDAYEILMEMLGLGISPCQVDNISLETPLMTACRKGLPLTVGALLNYLTVEQINTFSEISGSFKSALLIAVQKGFLSCTKLLIKAGADVWAFPNAAKSPFSSCALAVVPERNPLLLECILQKLWSNKSIIPLPDTHRLFMLFDQVKNTKSKKILKTFFFTHYCCEAMI